LLAVGKQAYEELTQLISIADLKEMKFPDGAKRERVSELLRKLDGVVSSVRKRVAKTVLTSLPQ
jgi:hypothetical protein